MLEPARKDLLLDIASEELSHLEVIGTIVAMLEIALYAIKSNFSTGKLQGDQRFTNVYMNMSHGGPDLRGPWNEGDQWQFVSDANAQAAVDGGDGLAHVETSVDELTATENLAMRTKSDPTSRPMTGAELGAEGGMVSRSETNGLTAGASGNQVH